MERRPKRQRFPTLKQLSYFVALEEKRHFGKAAEACFVSQSAFSVAIRELEKQLGTQLVDRTNKRVTITATGKEVATQARLVLRDMELLVESAGTPDEPLSGPLRLGTIPTIAPFVLPTLVPALRKSHPRLELYLREDLTGRIYERMMDGDLDLILIALPYELRGVESQTLFSEPFLLACRQGSRLVDPHDYSFSRLDTGTVLLLEDGHCLRDHALAACRIRNLDKISRFSATSLQTLVQMVDSDLGITYLPEMVTGSALLRGTRVKTFPMRRPGHRDIGLVWRQGSARATEFRLLGEAIAGHR